MLPRSQHCCLQGQQIKFSWFDRCPIAV